MEKHIELLKKLKAHADRGEGGEKLNAQKLFDTLLQKYGLTIEDIEGEKVEYYYFKAHGIYATLLHQIMKRVNYDLKVGKLSAKRVKALGVPGGQVVKCTVAEYIEIEQMFEVYKKLYKKENDVFYLAFLTANDLLIKPPKSEAKTTKDLTPEELKEWMRVQSMASKIKKETIRKRLECA